MGDGNVNGKKGEACRLCDSDKNLLFALCITPKKQEFFVGLWIISEKLRADIEYLVINAYCNPRLNVLDYSCQMPVADEIKPRRLALMKLLEDRIVADGRILPGDVLKVDSFINHQIDVQFVCQLGKEFFRRFEGCGVTKILTIEASGIGIACLTAQYFGVPVVFAKKSTTSNLGNDVYATTVDSYTHGRTYDVLVSKRYLSPEDRVLVIDDFLAKGNALNALTCLVQSAGATLVGCGVVIEKAYQEGGDMIRSRGIRVESLARIASMSTEDGITFLPDHT